MLNVAVAFAHLGMGVTTLHLTSETESSGARTELLFSSLAI